MKKFCLLVLNLLLTFAMFANDERSSASQLLEKQLWANFASDSEINGIPVDSYSLELKHLIKKSLVLAFSHGHQACLDRLKTNNSIVVSLQGLKEYTQKVKNECMNKGGDSCLQKIKSTCLVIKDKEDFTDKINDLLAKNFDLGEQARLSREKNLEQNRKSVDHLISSCSSASRKTRETKVVNEQASVCNDELEAEDVHSLSDFDECAAQISYDSSDNNSLIDAVQNNSKKSPKKRKYNAVAVDESAGYQFKYPYQVKYNPRPTKSRSQSIIENKS